MQQQPTDPNIYPKLQCAQDACQSYYVCRYFNLCLSSLPSALAATLSVIWLKRADSPCRQLTSTAPSPPLRIRRKSCRGSCGEDRGEDGGENWCVVFECAHTTSVALETALSSVLLFFSISSAHVRVCVSVSFPAISCLCLMVVIRRTDPLIICLSRASSFPGVVSLYALFAPCSVRGQNSRGQGSCGEDRGENWCALECAREPHVTCIMLHATVQPSAPANVTAYVSTSASPSTSTAPLLSLSFVCKQKA